MKDIAIKVIERKEMMLSDANSAGSISYLYSLSM